MRRAPKQDTNAERTIRIREQLSDKADLPRNAENWPFFREPTAVLAALAEERLPIAKANSAGK